MLGIAVAGVHAIHAQQPDPAARVRIHTVMERYAPEYVLPPDERRRLKSERRDTIARQSSIYLDQQTPPAAARDGVA
jgi:hypothetical protein